MMNQLRGLATAAEASAPLKGIRAAVILSRTPIVTQDVGEFDRKFFNYQKELEKRLMWTFPKWYYLKKGTVAEREFAKVQNYPLPGRKGVWFPKGQPEIRHGRDRRFKQEVVLPKPKNEEEGADSDSTAPGGITTSIQLQSRVTEADKTNDQTSLERQLARTLYLLVKQDGVWKFPAFSVADESKPLADVAEDGLLDLGGNKINIWTVSGTPAAVLKSGPDREYLIKSHIVAGQFAPKDLEYKWLNREETQELVDNTYWEKIAHLLYRV